MVRFWQERYPANVLMTNYASENFMLHPWFLFSIGHFWSSNIIFDVHNSDIYSNLWRGLVTRFHLLKLEFWIVSTKSPFLKLYPVWVPKMDFLNFGSVEFKIKSKLHSELIFFKVPYLLILKPLFKWNSTFLKVEFLCTNSSFVKLRWN